MHAPRFTVPLLAVVSAVLVGCGGSGSALQAAGEAGRTVYASVARVPTEEADTILLLARTHAHLTAAGVLDDDEQLRDLLDELIARRIEGEGGWGWGQAFEWDAYGDGVVNPPDTIYSYTTAAAALAFLDGYAVLEDETYLEAAEQAVGALLTDTCCWTDGAYTSVWYDDQANDQRDDRQVHNVNGSALAAIARLDRARGRETHGELAARMAEHLIDEQGRGYAQERYGQTPVSEANWRYSRGEPGRPNDLIHETFIVEGLLEYGSPEAVAAARRSLDGIVASHFEDAAPREGLYTFGSLGWGPGAGLFILSSSDEHRDDARHIAERIIDSIGEDGRTELAAGDELRAQAWYALGLARFANEEGLPRS